MSCRKRRCSLASRLVVQLCLHVVQFELCGSVTVSAEPGEAARLLLLAREHAVEPCVAACLQLLLDKVRCGLGMQHSC